jgi:uncharacterized membrane protein YidH (DUF202 family)
LKREELKMDEDVVTLLARVTELEEQQNAALQEQNELARKRTQTTSHLAAYSLKTAEHAEQQTLLARERTALTREQTRLSSRSAELASVRTELSQERTAQAEERSRLSMQRTEMARRRTAYAEWRTRLSEQRTNMAHRRTFDAVTRTRLSLQRTELARGRTFLALTRTGLAFLTLGVTFFRYFGLSAWTAFDLALVAFSSVMVYFGVRGYYRAKKAENALTNLLSGEVGKLLSDNVGQALNLRSVSQAGPQ